MALRYKGALRRILIQAGVDFKDTEPVIKEINKLFEEEE